MPAAFWEFPGLIHRILPGSRIQDKQDLFIAVRQLPLEDPADFCQLVHQVFLVVQPAGRVADQDVCPKGFGFGDGIENDGSRIRPFFAFDQRHTRAVCPDLQLIDGGGAEGIRRA